MKKLKFINSNLLKVLAMIFMLLDHMWATIIPGNQWMTIVGRLAFPIFAFLIVEGFIHTSDFNKYAKRLFIFGLISEIPFNLIYTGSLIFPFHQNVMFTLLLGLLCINEIDKIKKNKNRTKSIFKILLFLLISIISFVDYGATGVLTIIIFYIFRDFKFAWIGQLISLILLYIVFFKGQSIILNIFGLEYFLPIQSIGILALIPIWLYNGKRGKKNKILQYSFYAFYPIHMLGIYLIYYFVL